MAKKNGLPGKKQKKPDLWTWLHQAGEKKLLEEKSNFQTEWRSERGKSFGGTV